MKIKNIQFEEFYQNFINKINKIKIDNDRILMVTHNYADIDAFSSILGFYYIITNYFKIKNSEILLFLPDYNRQIKKMIEELKIQESFNIITNKTYLTNFITNNYFVFILDTNKIQLINCNSEIFKNENLIGIILIDHHQIPEEISNIFDQIIGFNENIIENSLFLIEPNYSSSAELITKIWKNIDQETNINNHKIKNNSELIAQLLLCGILSDSNGLKYSKNFVISLLDFLISHGADLEKARELNMYNLDRNEKIARIKGALRVKQIHEIGKWIVVFTCVNSYEGSVCNALIELGADIAFCYSEKKDENIIIVRASEEFQLETSFNFGKFMEEMGNELGGSGGGHEGAAGLKFNSISENIEKILIDKLRNKLLK